MSFIQAEWNCTNLQLKDGPVLKVADGGTLILPRSMD